MGEFLPDEAKDNIDPEYIKELGALGDDSECCYLLIPILKVSELCLASGKPQKGDLLMLSICPDGRIWLVDTNTLFYFKDGRVLWIHWVSDKVDSRYLQYVLKDLFMTDYESIASGTMFVELKISALKKILVMLASIKLQSQFSDFIVAEKGKRRKRKRLVALRAASRLSSV